ncbi:MAG: phosphate ABC transporter substrate-binding protein [Deltaproteobacteria bacterium]|nr:phosphate ABC transporter substrate-binding protein [Deltaproteobacteria bacterium]
MRLFKIAVFSILISFLCLIHPGCSSEKQPKIRVEGSTTILPFMVRVSALYSGKGNAEIQVNSGGSKKGLEALISGKCDMAMCSSSIPAGMLAHAASKGIRIKGFSFACDMIVPIVHPSNPINNLSLDQLSGIYRGTIDSWAAVGGRDALIDVVTRTPSSGTGEIWKQVLLKLMKIKGGCTIRNSNSGVLAYVAEHSEATGYVSFAILNHEVKPLSINGVAPTVENAKQGMYPISRNLYLYVDEKNFSRHMKSLIVFILSDKGQQIAKESGFIPRDALK